MKPDMRVLEVNSTLQGEKVGMTIDDGALAHIMSVLTDLYSDPEMAIIREYSTNAYDAHVEAGVKKPIQVQTPTSLAPFFRVRDFGEGLDAQDIREIYSRYGASSKRNSNDVVGMLGLGCKSALTYTDQFTLTGIKNGIETQVSISRDEDGGGSMTIVAQNKTDAESGVEIIVPVKRYNDIVSKCAKFFSVWEKGTVLVDGKEPKRMEGLMPLTDNIFSFSGYDRYQQAYSMIVMGNVTYPITDQHESWPFIAFVEIGDVEFSPSRESLRMTKKTREKIAELRAIAKRERDAAIERNIAQAKTAREALEIYHSSSDRGYRGNPTWNGHAIQHNIMAADGEQWIIAKLKHQSYSRGWDHYKNVGTRNMHEYIWLIGFESDKLTPYKRKKLNQWAAKQNLSGSAILVKTLPKSPWIEKANVYDWKDVEAEKLDRVTSVTSKGRPTGSYRGIVCGLHQDVILAGDIDTSKPLFYVNLGELTDSARIAILEYFPDATIITLTRNRMAKFERDFPMAKTVEDEYKKLKTEWEKSLSDDDKLTLKLNRGSHTDTLKKLDPVRIDDPELKNYVTLAKRNINKLIVRAKLFGHNTYNSYYYHTEADMVKPFKDYPLLTNLRGHDRMYQDFLEHLYTYVNAAYAARQEKN
jgi:hypothetical protein